MPGSRRRDRGTAFATQVPADLQARARAAVAALQADPPDDDEGYRDGRVTLARMTTEALEVEVRRLEITYNGGQPFPPPPQRRLKVGPPAQ